MGDKEIQNEVDCFGKIVISAAISGFEEIDGGKSYDVVMLVLEGDTACVFSSIPEKNLEPTVQAFLQKLRGKSE